MVKAKPKPKQYKITDIDDVLMANATNETESDEISKYKVLADTLFNVDKNSLLLKTEISDKEIQNINRLISIADTYDIPILYDIVERFLKLRISKDRKGRGEVLNATIRDIEEKKEMREKENEKRVENNIIRN